MKHFIFTGLFDISTEIEVRNLDEPTFTSSKPIWKQIFNKIFIAENMIELRYNQRTSKINIAIRSQTSAKKNFILDKIKASDILDEIIREKDKYLELKGIAVPQQELKPIVKPVSGKLHE